MVVNGFENLEVARGFWKRFRGLMGKTYIPVEYALAFPQCSSIHTCFMRIPIDVIYLNVRGECIGVETLEPWRLGHAPEGTETVVECAAGTCDSKGIGVGWSIGKTLVELVYS